MPNQRFYGEVKQAWGEWLKGMAEWEWFVTMTFRNPPHLPGRATYTAPGWAYAKGAWRKFLALTPPAIEPLTWVRCFEMQEDRNVPHIHALVAGIAPGIRRMDLVDWAWVNYGMARILPYDPTKGADYYLCKYFSKELSDIEFGGLE